MCFPDLLLEILGNLEMNRQAYILVELNDSELASAAAGWAGIDLQPARKNAGRNREQINKENATLGEQSSSSSGQTRDQLPHRGHSQTLLSPHRLSFLKADVLFHGSRWDSCILKQPDKQLRPLPVSSTQLQLGISLSPVLLKGSQLLSAPSKHLGQNLSFTGSPNEALDEFRSIPELWKSLDAPGAHF